MARAIELSTHNETIPHELLGDLRELTPTDATDGEVLRRCVECDGYLFLRNVLNRDAVLAAWHDICAQLAAVGEIDDPLSEGRSTGTSRRGDLVDDLGRFWKKLSETESLRRVTHTGPIRSIMDALLGGIAKPFDFLWLRAMHLGHASAYHFDHVYMNRGTDHLFTVWTPLGDVTLDEGPIALVEGSHRWNDLIAQYSGFDVDTDASRPGHVTTDPVSLVRERGSRLLTAEFRAGDVLVFPMFMLHGSLDNRSTMRRVRFSCDTRYQLASEPFDRRWIGENPVSHGSGYASLSGAKPPTDEPIFR